MESIQPLPCHLPGEQIVYFNDENVRDTVERGPPRTKLTAFSDLNRTDDNARHIPYPDIPKYFIWNAKEKKWDRRSEGSLDENGLYTSEKLGRIPIISLNAYQAELYYLRMLLYNTTGATNFEDLRSTGETLHPTYQETCRHSGLIEDDDEIDH